MEMYKTAYRWTREEFSKSLRHHNNLDVRKGFLIALNALLVILCLASVFLLVVHNFQLPYVVSAICMVGVTLNWVRRQALANFLALRNFDKQVDADKCVEWEISEEAIKISCEGVSKSEFQWKVFIKIVETSEGFLFYVYKNIFYWQPFSAFKEFEGISKVRQFAETNGIPFVVQAGQKRK